MRLHYLQHVPFESPGEILNICNELNISISSTKLYAGEKLPELNEFDILLIMGGPMSIYDYDEFPWLKSEREFIVRAILAKKKILGVCLGAQLLADVFGAKVYKGEYKEIGWMPLRKVSDHELLSTFPKEFHVMHWHGDTFETPKEAERLFESEVCTNQGFIYDDRVVALQFHIEMNDQSLADIVENCADELAQGGKYVHSAEQIISDSVIHMNNCHDYIKKIIEYLT